MLVAEADLEVNHLFARALKTEMARLDDPGVYRSNCNLVNFATVHAEKIMEDRSAAVGCAQGFEPRMAGRHQGVLLPNLALEQMRLRMRRGERRIAPFGGCAARDRQGIVRVEGDHRHQPGSVALRHAEPRAKSGTAIQLGRSLADEFRHRPFRHLGPGETGRIGEQGKR